MYITAVVSLIVFVGLVIFLVIIRLRTGNRIEIKNTDILLAIIPVVLFLLITGKITKFEFGMLKFETVFKEAASKKIESEIITLQDLPIRSVESDIKLGINKIPELIEKKTEALEFRLGYGRYYGPAIRDYLNSLAAYPFFNYIIINKMNGEFFAIMNAQHLFTLINTDNSPYNPSDLANWLNNSDEEIISKLPGTILLLNAIDANTDKNDALKQMEQIDVDFLPVVDDEKRFVGIVDRSRLLSSLIVDVSNRLND
ncbi:CBS domain-containing protein [candidate division KSB1 bacterium]|nr:CBS domain-containing protein [candidate division KSB1 bacterium]